MRLKKYANNPVITSDPSRPWEALVTTNPGVWYDEDSSEFIMLYRAAGNEKEHNINLGLAVSKDGFHFEKRSNVPLFNTGDDNWDSGSIEDPRIVKFGEYYFVTYASVSYAPGRYWEFAPGKRRLPDVPDETPSALRNNLTRTGLAITKDFKKIYRLGPMTDQTLDDRDVVIFPEKVNGRFVTLHRPMQWTGAEYGIDSPSIWIAYCDDLLENKKLTLLATAEYEWEVKIGAASPPLRCDAGWFMLYHAVGLDNKYRVGAMILDHNDPAKILYRSPEPLMVPEYAYETTGIYNGICFPCGNVVKDGVLYVYYGGADQHVGVATCEFEELIRYLCAHPFMSGTTLPSVMAFSSAV